MISLKEKQLVIQLYLQGMSQRKIEAQVALSRTTISKYIKEYIRSTENGDSDESVPYIASQPRYKKRKGRKRVLTPTVQKRLRHFIKQNEMKRQQNMGKQQMKIIDMFEKLQSEGFEIGYTTVRSFVNQEMKKHREVFIRQEPDAGIEAQFDWGELKLEIRGKLRPYHLAVFSLPYSNYRFAYLYEGETMVCLQDAHVRFFNTIGFIPARIAYDNMRTVVRKFIGRERFITDAMTAMSLHYKYQIRLCEPRKGNQKGSVERSVEFIRRKAFSSDTEFIDIAAARKQLEKTLTVLNNRPHYLKKRPHLELMGKEREQQKRELMPFPYDPAELFEYRVSKYSTIQHGMNRYSVPEGHVGEFVKVKVGARKLRIFIDGELMAEHERDWGRHKWRIDLFHYVGVFQQKKGALPQSKAMSQAPEKIKKLYQDHYIGKEKNFLELLEYIKNKDVYDRMIKVIEEVMEKRDVTVTTENLILICERNHESTGENRKFNAVDEQSQQNLKRMSELFLGGTT